jgi:ketosteroid isomerase-like protein
LAGIDPAKNLRRRAPEQLEFLSHIVSQLPLQIDEVGCNVIGQPGN